jgi:hypothetical protein
MGTAPVRSAADWSPLLVLDRHSWPARQLLSSCRCVGNARRRDRYTGRRAGRRALACPWPLIRPMTAALAPSPSTAQAHTYRLKPITTPLTYSLTGCVAAADILSTAGWEWAGEGRRSSGERVRNAAAKAGAPSPSCDGRRDTKPKPVRPARRR